MLTNQVDFPEALTVRLFATEAPCPERGPSPFTNGNDRMIHDSGGADGGLLRMSREGEWHLGTLTLGVATQRAPLRGRAGFAAPLPALRVGRILLRDEAGERDPVGRVEAPLLQPELAHAVGPEGAVVAA